MCPVDPCERSAIRALNIVQVVELSSAHQALEGAEVAPGTENILKEIFDTPQVAGPHSTRGHGACPSSAIRFGPTLLLGERVVGQTRHRRRTFRHDCGTSSTSVGQPQRSSFVAHIGRGFGQPWLRCDWEECSLYANLMGVRGLVAGDMVRRLVSRTMAQWMSTAVKSAFAPLQYACQSVQGVNAFAHVLLQGLTTPDLATTSPIATPWTRVLPHPDTNPEPVVSTSESPRTTRWVGHRRPETPIAVRSSDHETHWKVRT